MMTARSIAVNSTKYDGSLHYLFEAEVVGESEGFLALYVAPGQNMDSYRGSMTTKEHFLMLWWRDRLFELEVVWNRTWRPRMHYVNIGRGFEWYDNQLRWVDLDLDLIWRANATSVVIDDEDEFEEHRVAFGYPDQLVKEAWAAVDEVQGLFAARAAPYFDGSLYKWRPGAPVPVAP
jgi:protein associated with RNAse G/E